MLLSKFSWCNRLTITQLARLMATLPDEATTHGVDLRRADRLNVGALVVALGSPATSSQGAFCVEQRHHLLWLAATELRYCPECLSTGFHSPIFQWRFFVRCPIHRMRMRTGCPRCGASVPYRLGAQLADCPLRCPYCHAVWVPCLQRHPGRCSRLNPQQADAFAQWADYLTHAIGPAGHRLSAALDRSAGRLSDACRRAHHQTAKRFAYVSTLNRLYPTPPPRQIVRAAAAPMATAVAISPEITDRRVQPPSWPRQQWRHFNVRFIALEAILDGARNYLVATTRGARTIVTFNLNGTVAADKSCVDEMATLGWCMSWYGHLRAESIFRPRLYPAFGLAAWLANLPERPRLNSHHEWFAQVAESLRDDLDASWNTWHQITAFMNAHGTYFLHPALAQPADFAARRQNCIS